MPGELLDDRLELDRLLDDLVDELLNDEDDRLVLERLEELLVSRLLLENAVDESYSSDQPHEKELSSSYPTIPLDS